jgi:hypothetical protein
MCVSSIRDGKTQLWVRVMVFRRVHNGSREIKDLRGGNPASCLSWLVRSWSTFGARTNHAKTRIHKTHHNPDLGEATTFPFIIFSVFGHMAYVQMSFCLETPNSQLSKFSKFSKLGLSQLWKPITSCVDL